MEEWQWCRRSIVEVPVPPLVKDMLLPECCCHIEITGAIEPMAPPFTAKVLPGSSVTRVVPV